MCTALSIKTDALYFGRTLDLDRSYGEEVCVMPRRFPFKFRKMGEASPRFALIGMATVVDGVPLFYDGANEHGLCMAGLNFPANAYYPPPADGKDNVTPFEFIPWILGGCKTVADAKNMINRINLVDIQFSKNLPLTPLHWIITDKSRSIVVEPMREGLRVHENPTGVMTNNPPFDYHLMNLNNYRRLSVKNGENLFSPALELTNYSGGLGAVGLPGDVSSASRFVRAAFYAKNSVCDGGEPSSVGQFFHILGTVERIRGGCLSDGGKWDTTVYTSCINAEAGRYYYTTYGNRRISCVDMHKTDLNSAEIARFPLILTEQIFYQN